MDRIEFVVPGEPVGKGRPRFALVKNVPRAYTPQRTRDYESLIRTCWKTQVGDDSFLPSEAIGIEIHAEYGIAQSNTKSVREQKMVGDLRPTKKPDADNVLKVILDALNGVAYCDDSQICDVRITKTYSEDPKVTVVLYVI